MVLWVEIIIVANYDVDAACAISGAGIGTIYGEAGYLACLQRDGLGDFLCTTCNDLKLDIQLSCRRHVVVGHSSLRTLLCRGIEDGLVLAVEGEMAFVSSIYIIFAKLVGEALVEDHAKSAVGGCAVDCNLCLL